MADTVIVRSDDPRCAELEATGYVIAGESWAARLRLPQEFDAAPFEATIARILPLTLRALTTSDADDLVTLEAANHADYPVTPATVRVELDLVAARALLTSTSLAIGAFDGKTLVGATQFTPADERVEIEFASVLASHRGRGIAAALGAYGILALAATGARHFGTGGAAVNAASLGAVRSLGFTVTERWRSYVLS